MEEKQVKSDLNLNKISLYEFRHNLGLLLDTRYKLLGLQLSHIEKEYSFWFKEKIRFDSLETHEGSWTGLFKHEKLLKDNFFVVTKNGALYVRSNTDKLAEESAELFSFANYKVLEQWKMGKPSTAEVGVQVSMMPPVPNYAEVAARLQERIQNRNISVESGASVTVKGDVRRRHFVDCEVQTPPIFQKVLVESCTQTPPVPQRRSVENATQTPPVRKPRFADSSVQTHKSTSAEIAVQTPQRRLVVTGVQTIPVQKLPTVNARIQTRLNGTGVDAGVQTSQNSDSARVDAGTQIHQKSSSVGTQNSQKSSFVPETHEIQSHQRSSSVGVNSGTRNSQKSSSVGVSHGIQSLQRSSSVEAENPQKYSSVKGTHGFQRSSSVGLNGERQNPRIPSIVGVDAGFQVHPPSRTAEISVQTLRTLELQRNDEHILPRSVSQQLPLSNPVQNITKMSSEHGFSRNVFDPAQTAESHTSSSCVVYDYGHSSQCNSNFSANETVGTPPEPLRYNNDVDYRANLITPNISSNISTIQNSTVNGLASTPAQEQIIRNTGEIEHGERKLASSNKRRTYRTSISSSSSCGEENEIPVKRPKFQQTFQAVNEENDAVRTYKTVAEKPLESASTPVNNNAETSLVKIEEQEQLPKINEEVLDIDLELRKIFEMLPDDTSAQTTSPQRKSSPTPNRSKPTPVDPNALVTDIDDNFLEEVTKLVQKTSGPRRLIGSRPKNFRKERWIVFPMQNKGLGIYLSNQNGTPYLWKGDRWDPDFPIPRDGSNLPFELPPNSLLYGEFLVIRQEIVGTIFVEFNVIDVGAFFGNVLHSDNFYNRFSLCRKYLHRNTDYGPGKHRMFVNMKPTQPLHTIQDWNLLRHIKWDDNQKTYYINRVKTSLDVSGIGLIQVFPRSQDGRKNEFQFGMKHRYILDVEHSSASFLETTTKELSKIFEDMVLKPTRT